MKNFAGLALSLGLATGGASAQNNPAPNPFLEENGTPPPSMVEFGGNNGTIGVFNSEKYGPGVSGRLVFQNGKCGLVLDGEFAQHDRNTLAAAGCDVINGDNSRTILLFGGAWRETDLSRALSDSRIPDNTDGRGKQVFLTFVNAGKKHSFAFTARAGEADDTELYGETRLLGAETTTTRQGGYMVTRRTDILQDYLTTAYGHQWMNAEIGGTFHMRKGSEITFAVGGEIEWSGRNHENTDTNVIGSILSKTSFDMGSLVVGASRYGKKNGVSVDWEMPVWNNEAALGFGVSHVGNDTLVRVNIIVPLGKYTRPQYGQKPLSEETFSRALSLAADSEGNHVSDLSTRYELVTEAVGVARRDTEETGRTMVPNSPFTIGSTSCTLTTFTAGNTTVCTLSPTDPDGVASVTATVDGNPVAVNFDGATYSISLSGSELGEGTHTLVWTGTGRKPDGTPEPIAQTISRTITVTSANHAPVPTFDGMAFDASLNTNVSGQLTATDADAGDTLTYALVTPPSSGNIMVNPNGSFTITGAMMPGTYTFAYSVTDGKSVPVTKLATLTVNNLAPVAPAGSPFAATFEITRDDNLGASPIDPINLGGVVDPLGRILTYTAIGLPSGLSIDPSTGIITGTHDSDAGGGLAETSPITLTVSNGSMTISKTFILHIVDRG